MTLYLQGTPWMIAARAVPIATSSSASQVRGDESRNYRREQGSVEILGNL